ncbi:MAG: D-glycero-beta-D-manno-heptose 1-phosphate adenylyltransferase [Deltaproteobacteria bacterium]|nr:D-glycero-beta-D-manno-heptose 1-phosphate adenylyltransferase [Deltaproteobacteria bacterium]
MKKKSPHVRPLNSKILAPSRAASLCRRIAARGRRVVFTNGCFDILHPGHVTYLERARACGDFLIVALDTDAAVRALKGKGRPINPLRSRQQVVAALESVDAVTSFGGGDPVPLIKKLQPAILVKGGDWKVARILGSREVASWGGKAYSLPFVAGKSTTRIIRKIRKR